MPNDKITCANCEHMTITDHYGGYCYMFKEKPDVVKEWGGYCAQHTSMPKLPPLLARLCLALQGLWTRADR